MDSSAEQEARARLRERLGAGARYDADAAPAEDLLLARRGTAYFARKLNELSDSELDGPSLAPGWSRRHVVAHVGYNARRLARIVAAARQGSAEELPPDALGPPETIEFGATLPPHALRYLFQHSAVHLNVEWRDLTDAGWERTVKESSGRLLKVRPTPLLRAREVWMRAVELGNGASTRDVPAELAERIRQKLTPTPDLTFIGWLPRDLN